MNNIENNTKLYNFKKCFIMVAAILIGSIFGGYHAYKASGGHIDEGSN